MNLEITAITLSGKPMPQVLCDVVSLNQVQKIQSCADYNSAFYSAIDKVQTPFFFFLDDDDTLPDDYLSVLSDCLKADADIAYTDEERVDAQDRTSVARSGEYSKEKHLTNPLMLHHLVLCKTNAAKKTIPALPKGQFWPEMPLYFGLARGSAAYIPRIGYRWKKSGSGLSTTADIGIGQMRSRIWCSEAA